MKWVAVALNLAFIGVFLYIYITDGMLTRGEGILFAGIVLAAPMSALVALFMKSGDSWLAMYLRRKKLEEKAKIEKLQILSK